MPTTSRRGIRRRTTRVLVAVLAAVVALAGLATPAAAGVSVATPRVSGVDRYGTSPAVSQAAFPSGANTVIIASGRSFADGLAAAALAGHLDARGCCSSRRPVRCPPSPSPS